MIKMEPIEKIIQGVLASGRVKDEQPLSAIVIAPLGSGKNSLLKEQCLQMATTLYLSDATAFGIIDASDDLQDFVTGRYSHLVIPDLAACLTRKSETVAYLMQFLTCLIEEGLVDMATYAMMARRREHVPHKVHARAGLITSIPQPMFNDRRHRWSKMGFISRALPISFSYQVDTEIEILNSIKDQHHLHENTTMLELPVDPISIDLPRPIAERLSPYSTRLTSQIAALQHVYPFRIQRQLQTFVKALALLEGKHCVDEVTIQEFGRLANYINLSFNKI